MLVYISLLILLLLLRRNRNKMPFILSLIAIFIVLAFRDYNVGTDTKNYIEWFDMISASGDLNVVDAGELFYNYLFYYIGSYGLTFRWVIIFQTIFFLLPIAYVLYKECKYPINGLLFLYLLGFCFQFMNISRQMIAVSLVILSYYFLNKGNVKFFLGVVISATLVHSSSILAIVAYFIYKVNIQRRYLLPLIVVTYIFPYIININPIIDYLVANISFFAKYAVHTEDAISSTASFPIVPTILTIVYVYISSTYKRIDSFYFKLSFFNVLLANLIVLTPQWIARIMLNFSIAQVLFFTNITDLSSQYKISKFGVFSVYFYSCLFFFFYYIFLKYNGVFPYSFDFSFQ